MPSDRMLPKLKQHQGLLSTSHKSVSPQTEKDWGILTTKACYNRSVGRFYLLDRSLKDEVGERILTLDPRIKGLRPNQL